VRSKTETAISSRFFSPRELLDTIKNFENEQFSTGKKGNAAPRLEVVNDTGSTILLREEIARLVHQNQQLKEKVQYLEQQLKKQPKQTYDSGKNVR
jgi:hypothetical protein